MKYLSNKSGTFLILIMNIRIKRPSSLRMISSILLSVFLSALFTRVSLLVTSGSSRFSIYSSNFRLNLRTLGKTHWQKRLTSAPPWPSNTPYKLSRLPSSFSMTSMMVESSIYLLHPCTSTAACRCPVTPSPLLAYIGNILNSYSSSGSSSV